MLLAALLLVLQQTATVPPEVSYGYVAHSALWDFDNEPWLSAWLLRTNVDLPIVPESGGLLIDPPQGGETDVVLRPRSLNGRGEIRVGWNVDLPQGTGLVLELAAREGWFEGVEAAWVHVRSFGAVPPGAATDRLSASTLERAGEGWCASTPRQWVALRLRAFRSAASDGRPLVIARLSATLTDRTNVDGIPPPAMVCGLGLDLVASLREEALQRAAELAVLEPQPLPDSAPGAFASCAAMQATGMGHPLLAEQLGRRLSESPGTLGDLCQSVHESGCKTWIEVFSILPDVRIAQGNHGPLALRVRGPQQWVVLGSLDRFGNARIYAPGSALPQPETWSAAELEQRWFGAGGLAFACRR
jgi:hypothetical protein